MRYIFEPNQLTIRLEGFEQIWALKRRMQIPHYAIEYIDYVTHVPSMREYRNFGKIRIPGITIPWRFLAGTFWYDGGRDFCYLYIRQAGMLTITLKPGTLNYDHVRITCDALTAQKVTDWWQNRT